MKWLVLIGLLVTLNIVTFIHCETQNVHTLFYSPALKVKGNDYVIVPGHHKSLPAELKGSGMLDDPIAWTSYHDDVQKDGWGKLQIKTNDKFDNEKQAFAAGFAEGFTTAHLIGPYWDEFKIYNYNQTLTPQFDAFITQQYEYLEKNVNEEHRNENERQYWNQVGLILAQVKGMRAGYAGAAAHNPDLKPMSFADFWKFQYDGDTGDIQSAISPIDISKMNEEELTTHHLVRTKCSAFLKYTSDRSNILVSHTTWDTFSNMLRIYKVIELNFKNEGVLAVNQAANVISFSSSPAWLVSVDDFYLTSAGLIVVETTNDVFNMDLYKYAIPQTVPYWVRNAVANRNARSAPEWTNLFAQYNSGTYNNQWMIVDINKFVPGASQSHPDLFHVLEQLPGMIKTKSQSNYLDENGYWGSYNIPFYPEIFNASGYAAMEAKYGDYWSHNHCPRANIFRKYQSPVQNVEQMKILMRRNDWEHDPFSLGDACNQVAARCDLNSPSIGMHYRAFGQIDAKITDIHMAKKLRAIAQNGPTHNAPAPVFTWNSKWNSTPHALQPTTFNFDWVDMLPQSL